MTGEQEAAPPPANAGPASNDEEEYEPTPWHFKLMLLGLVLYLAYRAYQLVEWGIHRYL